MKRSAEPFVSVVTPVYNGEKYLSECIESVINQTYVNWEYIILDNCSTDNSLEIAKQHAAKDERIEVITNDEFLKQIPNMNAALQKISRDSKYCKQVHADDCIFPEYLEKMVARAEEYPTAGIVSSYRFLNTRLCGLHGEGLSYKITFMTGKEAGKMVMENRNYLFGSPTTVLYRSDLVRARDLFYDPSVIHADADTCFDLLRESDFAFVHQPLSFSRMHDETTTTFCDYYNTFILNKMYAIKTFGDYFLTSKEQEEMMARNFTEEHRWLARSLFQDHDRDVLHYHKKRLVQMGLKLNRFKIFKFFVKELVKIKPAVKMAKNRFNKSARVTKNEKVIQSTIRAKKKETVEKGMTV